MPDAAATESTPPTPPTVPTGEVAARAPAADRIVGAFLAAVCLAVLLVASGLRPAPAGHGTHEQLGLMRCGFVIATGKPCPTCGMTTAFAHAANGDLLSSLRTQPFGALLAVLTACGFWVGGYVAITGSRVGGHVARLLSPRVFWVMAGLALLSWGYKVLTWTGA